MWQTRQFKKNPLRYIAYYVCKTAIPNIENDKSRLTTYRHELIARIEYDYILRCDLLLYEPHTVDSSTCRTVPDMLGHVRSKAFIKQIKLLIGTVPNIHYNLASRFNQLQALRKINHFRKNISLGTSFYIISRKKLGI